MKRNSRLVLWKEEKDCIKGETVLEIEGSGITNCLKNETWGLFITEGGHLWKFQSDFHPLLLPKKVKSIAMNLSAALILLAEGTVYSMGKDQLQTGILGVEGIFESNEPILINDLERTEGIFLNESTAGAFNNDGDIYKWGSNAFKPSLCLSFSNKIKEVCVLNSMLCVLFGTGELNIADTDQSQVFSMKNIKNIRQGDTFVVANSVNVLAIGANLNIIALPTFFNDKVDRISVCGQIVYGISSHNLYCWDFPTFDARVYKFNNQVKLILASQGGLHMHSVLESDMKILYQLMLQIKSQDCLLDLRQIGISKIAEILNKKRLFQAFHLMRLDYLTMCKNAFNLISAKMDKMKLKSSFLSIMNANKPVDKSRTKKLKKFVRILNKKTRSKLRMSLSSMKKFEACLKENIKGFIDKIDSINFGTSLICSMHMMKTLRKTVLSNTIKDAFEDIKQFQSSDKTILDISSDKNIVLKKAEQRRPLARKPPARTFNSESKLNHQKGKPNDQELSSQKKRIKKRKFLFTSQTNIGEIDYSGIWGFKDDEILIKKLRAKKLKALNQRKIRHDIQWIPGFNNIPQRTLPVKCVYPIKYSNRHRLAVLIVENFIKKQLRKSFKTLR